MHHQSTTTLLACLVLSAGAVAGELEQKKVVNSPQENSWQFKLALPGWIPWLEGDTAINGRGSHISLGPDVLVPRIDLAADVRLEAHKGRLSFLGEVLYMSLSDGIGTSTILKKVDLQIDQTALDFAVAWRLIDSPRGYLDLVGGVRYTNLFQQAVTQANAHQIGDASTRLVDDVAARLADAASSRVQARVEEAVTSGFLRRLLSARLPEVPELKHPATLPISPLRERLSDVLRQRVQAIIDQRKAALAAAVLARAQAVGEAARAAAQRRVDELKADLSRRIASELTDKAGTRVARTDDWWDPYAGFRARYNLSDKYYLTAKGDIGGFGVGSDLTWSAEAAFGWQVSRSLFTEIGFRALGVDYEGDGFKYDMVTYGPQATLGINF